MIRSVNFARRLFLAATAFGMLVVPPMFFLEGYFGEKYPPAITHPEFYYGFVGAVFAWQLVYLLIALDPIRYRPLMLLGALCKGGFALTVLILLAQGRVDPKSMPPVLGDMIFAPLFVWAFVRTGGAEI
ncbi:MAG: hypothetical protein JNG90_05170 [Planctomycetaceae bacterium]|nr:hypothetical protein [Planctomycetaceae bacterium]